MIAPLFVIALLFGLCHTEERAMQYEQDFWIRNQKEMREMRWGWSY
jgi:hypothetical protein